MPVIRVTIEIAASPELCFDLARSVDAHMASTGATGERAVAGVTTGLIGAGQEVTWSARHFGVRQRLTSRITIFDPPRRFRDSMVRGAFARFDHDHFFERHGSGTSMTDVFDYDAPLGALGRLVARWILTPYMTRFLRERGEVLKRLAESGEWKCFLDHAPD